MPFTWGVKTQFSKEFSNYPQDQQDKILEFIEIFEIYGLKGQFPRYPGKISHSWAGLAFIDARYRYAKKHDLWHYHIGIPEYQRKHPKFLTSDYVLHFQWPDEGTHIDIIDVCYHYKADGTQSRRNLLSAYELYLQ